MPTEQQNRPKPQSFPILSLKFTRNCPNSLSNPFDLKPRHSPLTRTHSPDVDIADLENVISTLESAVYVRDAARKNRLYHDARRLPADDAEPKPRSVVQQTDRLDLAKAKNTASKIYTLSLLYF